MSRQWAGVAEVGQSSVLSATGQGSHTHTHLNDVFREKLNKTFQICRGCKRCERTRTDVCVHGPKFFTFFVKFLCHLWNGSFFNFLLLKHLEDGPPPVFWPKQRKNSYWCVYVCVLSKHTYSQISATTTWTRCYQNKEICWKQRHLTAERERAVNTDITHHKHSLTQQ